MDPFQKALTEVIRGYEDTQTESLPSWTCLSFLTGFLANQSKKMTAINEGLVTSCFEAYNAYRQLMAEGTAWNEADELKVANLPQPTPGVPNTVDLTCACRQEILKILKSLVSYLPAREIVYNEFGVDQLAIPLFDPHPLVRAESCSLISTFATFPDAWDQCAKSTRLFESVCRLVLHDPDSRTVAAAIATLAELTKTPQPSFSSQSQNQNDTIEAVITKLVNVIASLTRFLNLNAVPVFPISPGDADCCIGITSHLPCSQLGGEVASTLSNTVETIFKATSHISKPNTYERDRILKKTPTADFSNITIASTISSALVALANISRILPQGSDESKGADDVMRAVCETIVGSGAITAIAPLLRAELSSIRLSAASLIQHLVTTPIGKAIVADPSHVDVLVLLCSFVLAPVSMSTPSVGAANLLGLTGSGGKAYLGGAGVMGTSGLSPAPEPLRRAAATCLRAIGDHPRALPIIGALLLNEPDAAYSVLGSGPHIARIADRFLISPKSLDATARNLNSAAVLRQATLRLLELLVRTGLSAETVWSIPGIVARLNTLAQVNAAGVPGGEAVPQEALSANRCLAGLCQEIRDARIELESVRAKAKEEEIRPALEGRVLVPGVRPQGVWPF